MKTKLEEVKAQTLEVRGSNDERDVAHITEESLRTDQYSYPPCYEDDAVRLISIFYGHSMVYQYSEAEGEYCYFYYTSNKSSTSPNCCGNTYRYRLPFSKYDHTVAGYCSDRDELLKFTLK